MKKLDPYEELGVPRDADTATVRRAYKARAKRTHPDAGGSPEAFQATQRAMSVLSDPLKRKAYDETGVLPDDKVDNVRAGALENIQRHMGSIINEFAKQGGRDPRTYDVPHRLVVLLGKDIAQKRLSITEGQQSLEFLKDMRRRFRPKDPKDDPIGRGFDDQVARLTNGIASEEDNIRRLEMAIEIVRGYGFQWDNPHGTTMTFGAASATVSDCVFIR